MLPPKRLSYGVASYMPSRKAHLYNRLRNCPKAPPRIIFICAARFAENRPDFGKTHTVQLACVRSKAFSGSSLKGVGNLDFGG